MTDQAIDVVARKELADAVQVITALVMNTTRMLNRIVSLERRLSNLEDVASLGRQHEPTHVES